MTDVTTITVELEHEGRTRRVEVSLGPAIDLPHRGEPGRAMEIHTDGGAQARQTVEPGISWDAVLADIELVLEFEDRSNRPGRPA